MARKPKVYLYEDHNSVFEPVRSYVQLVESPTQADVILDWQDTLTPDRAEAAQRLGKSFVVFQHGRGATREYLPPRSKPALADRYFVWGRADSLRLEQAGVTEERIRRVGAPILSALTPRRAHLHTEIVFVTALWDRDIPENRTLARQLTTIAAAEGWNLTCKLTDGQGVEDYPRAVHSNRHSGWDHLTTCAELLATTDLVVCLLEETFELMAQALGIPVVAITDAADFSTLCGVPVGPLPYSHGVRQTSMADVREAIRATLREADYWGYRGQDVAWDEGSWGSEPVDPVTAFVEALKEFV